MCVPCSFSPTSSHLLVLGEGDVFAFLVTLRQLSVSFNFMLLNLKYSHQVS